MAIAIKSIPVLKNSEAQLFIKKAEKSLEKKDAINFSKQVASANRILVKAKMK